MSASWKTRDIKLPFWLGEICLFRKSFKLQTINVDFIRFDAANKDTQIPREIDENAQGMMLYSLPINEDHKTIWREEGYINYISQVYRRYYTDLDGTFENYMDQFSSKTRSTLKRKMRKFEKECGGIIDCRLYQTPDEIKEFYPLARAISKETYQEKLLDAGLPVDDGFKEDMMRHAKNGTVRAFILFQNDRPVAYLYLPIFNNIVIYAYVGYLPDVGHLSAGTVIWNSHLISGPY
jgi:predicted N-acyltransferase